MSRHEGYFRPSEIHLDRITWLLGVPSTAQRFRFERAELDFIHELSAADSVQFRRDPRWQPFGEWNTPRSTRSIFMNTELAPFDKLEVRQAVAAAIDRDAVAQLRGGHIEKADRLIPRGVLGFDDSFPGQVYDPDRAKQLMHKAGYGYDASTGQGGYPETIDYLVPSDSFDQQVAELFQQQLARIGIRIRIKAMSWTASQAQMGRRKQVRMGGHGWVADFDDPSDFFEPLFSSSSIQAEESSNTSFYSNPELDKTLAEARRELDPVKRKALYKRAEEIVRDDAPWVFVYGYRYYDVWQPYLHGYRPHPHYFQDLKSTWVDLEQRNRFRRAKGSPPLSTLSIKALALSLMRRGK